MSRVAFFQGVWSLLLASRRAASLDTWALPGDTESWRFHSLPEPPHDTLLRLLPGTASRMAELGVFRGELSKHLLEQMPQLELLLVDPYHLRLEGRALRGPETSRRCEKNIKETSQPGCFLDVLQRFGGSELQFRLPGAAAEQPQGLSSDALDVATERTQPHRARATHVVQMSGPAAEWVARSHAWWHS